MQTRIDYVRQAFLDFEAFIVSYPQTMVNNLQGAIEAEVQVLLNSAQATINSLDPNANGISTVVNDYQMQITAAQMNLQNQIQMDFETVKNAVTAMLDMQNSPSITKLWNDVSAPLEYF